MHDFLKGAAEEVAQCGNHNSLLCCGSHFVHTNLFIDLVCVNGSRCVTRARLESVLAQRDGAL